jgi:hypothetical protein
MKFFKKRHQFFTIGDGGVACIGRGSAALTNNIKFYKNTRRYYFFCIPSQMFAQELECVISKTELCKASFFHIR